MSSKADTTRIAMLSAMSMTLALVSIAPSLAGSIPDLAAVTDNASEPAWLDPGNDGMRQGRCTDGYPMHHMNQCGTATGGPSGGVH